MCHIHDIFIFRESELTARYPVGTAASFAMDHDSDLIFGFKYLVDFFPAIMYTRNQIHYPVVS